MATPRSPRKSPARRVRLPSERGEHLPPTSEQVATARALLARVTASLGYPLVQGRPAFGAWAALAQTAGLPRSYATTHLGRIWAGKLRLPEGARRKIENLFPAC